MENRNGEIMSDEAVNEWFLSQGYQEEMVTHSDYVQKTDDCDWVF
jgi:hypothetical protein